MRTCMGENMDTNLTYEEAMNRLETVVKELESGSKPLDDMLALYEEGMNLANHCSKKLSEYEAKLTTLTASAVKEEEAE